MFQFSLSLTARHSSNSSRNPSAFYTLWKRLVLLTWSVNTICSKNFLIHCFDDISVSGRISAVCFTILQLAFIQHSRTWISVWIFQETRPICLLRSKSISIVKRTFSCVIWPNVELCVEACTLWLLDQIVVLNYSILKYLLLAESLGPVTSALTQPELFTKATA